MLYIVFRQIHPKNVTKRKVLIYTHFPHVVSCHHVCICVYCGQMTSVERVVEYTQLEAEGPWETDTQPPPDWPAAGRRPRWRCRANRRSWSAGPSAWRRRSCSPSRWRGGTGSPSAPPTPGAGCRSWRRIGWTRSWRCCCGRPRRRCCSCRWRLWAEPQGVQDALGHRSGG